MIFLSIIWLTLTYTSSFHRNNTITFFFILGFKNLNESLTTDEKNVIVSQSTLQETLIGMYSQQPDLPLHITRVTFKNEEGDDQGGLTRELFTAFWADSF